MQKKPDFIDNLNGNSMANALKEVLENLSTKPESIRDIESGIDELRIATEYFSPEGFSRISSMRKDIPSIKLILDSDPITDNERLQKKLKENQTGNQREIIVEAEVETDAQLNCYKYEPNFFKCHIFLYI